MQRDSSQLMAIQACTQAVTFEQTSSSLEVSYSNEQVAHTVVCLSVLSATLTMANWEVRRLFRFL